MKKKWWLFVTIGALAAIGIFIFNANRVAQAKLDAALEHARRVGMPLEPMDLKKRNLPPMENAAEEYRKAIASLSLISKGDTDLIQKYPGAMEKPDPADAFRRMGIQGKVDNARIAKALEAWTPAFDHIAKAVQKPHLDWERPWEKSAFVQFSEFGPLKEMVKVMMLDAKRAAWAHDTNTIKLRISEGRQIAAHLAEEPTLISALVGIANQSIVSTQAMLLAYEFRDDPAIVAAIREALSKPVTLPDLRLSLSGEAVFARTGVLMMAKDPSAFGALSGQSDDERSRSFSMDTRFLKVPWVRAETEALVISRYADAYEKLPTDPNAWKESSKVLSELDRSFADQSTRPARIASFMVPVFAAMGDSVGNVLLYQRQAIIVTHLIDIHRSTGAWPAKLPALPGVDVDPFSGKPFIYRKTTEGFVLYSVGADGKDDGGSLEPSSRKDRAVGIVKGKLTRR